MLHKIRCSVYFCLILIKYRDLLNAVVRWITTARYLIPELRFCAGSNTARRESEIQDGRLEIRLNRFSWSTIPQKQFIIITIIIIIIKWTKWTINNIYNICKILNNIVIIIVVMIMIIVIITIIVKLIELKIETNKKKNSYKKR